jgi:hypothetical protein
MESGAPDPHVERRESALGRGIPAAFYLLNIALWLITALAFGVWDLLHLALLTLPWLALYVRQTRRA